MYIERTPDAPYDTLVLPSDAWYPKHYLTDGEGKSEHA